MKRGSEETRTKLRLGQRRFTKPADGVEFAMLIHPSGSHVWVSDAARHGTGASNEITGELHTHSTRLTSAFDPVPRGHARTRACENPSFSVLHSEALYILRGSPFQTIPGQFPLGKGGCGAQGLLTSAAGLKGREKNGEQELGECILMKRVNVTCLTMNNAPTHNQCSEKVNSAAHYQHHLKMTI